MASFLPIYTPLQLEYSSACLSLALAACTIPDLPQKKKEKPQRATTRNAQERDRNTTHAHK